MTMTDLEKQEIIDSVVSLLKKDSLTIDQLANTDVLDSEDMIELNRGRKVSLNALRDFIRGYGIYLEIIGKNDETLPSDNNVFSAVRTLYEISKNTEYLKKLFLRKDQSDGTNFLLKFGDFIDSMIAGKGAGIYPNGRGQFSRLEVRDALVVMRLIINEIQAMAGDFSFSDAGCIEKVEDLGDDTYKLWMEKRTEYDVTNFTENDIMYSIINNLLTGGTDYYTSWFRCLTKNVNDNTLTVVLYPDSEVPGGKNYPPVADTTSLDVVTLYCQTKEK